MQVKLRTSGKSVPFSATVVRHHVRQLPQPEQELNTLPQSVSSGRSIENDFGQAKSIAMISLLGTPKEGSPHVFLRCHLPDTC